MIARCGRGYGDEEDLDRGIDRLRLFWDIRVGGIRLRFLVWMASPVIWAVNVAAWAFRRKGG